MADEPSREAANYPNPSQGLHRQSAWHTLMAGATAGLVVDTALYPVDTIKSRLQSQQGFSKAGGFANLYRGLPPVLAGSIPNAAAFFIVYETVKDKLQTYRPLGITKANNEILSHIIAASLGEVASCVVRVPYEVIKMRSQTSDAKKVNNLAMFKDVIAREGFIGLYRGFMSTVIRDLPFSAIQYPIWEQLKKYHLNRNQRQASTIESAYYGSIAGAIAAFLTTPLDVAKTRIMLAEEGHKLASGRVLEAVGVVWAEGGLQGLFAGVVPRIIWISVGAAIFLGSYEQAIKMLAE